jgi:hypothetical protein
MPNQRRRAKIMAKSSVFALMLVLALAVVPAQSQVILYDNGPLVNSPGTGAGGADESVLQQNSLGMNIYGVGHAVSTGFRIADDFTVLGPNPWMISSIRFYAYQTGSTTTSTITAVNYQIWNGPPGQPGSSVIWGDTTTNRLADSSWSNIYRVLDNGAPDDTNRPIMVNAVDAGFTLYPGTYWIDWQTDGSLASGPWAPPITINGQTTTGNGKQFDPNTTTWNDAVDVGQQGFPFIIMGGEYVPTSVPTLNEWGLIIFVVFTGVLSVYFLRRRRIAG